MVEINFKKIILGIIWLFIVILGFSSFYTIQPWEIWIEKYFGEVKWEVKREWLHWKMPIISSVQKMNIRNIVVTETATAASKDIQDVTTDIAVNFSIEPSRAIELYKTVWTEIDIQTNLVSKATQEAVKASTAQFSATESITKRTEVREMMVANLKEKLEKRGLIINQVDILNFEFSKSFNDAIEAKVTAEQNALTAEKNLEKVKFEAQQQIETSKAEAEKIRIQAEAITKQGWEEYVKLQWIQKWNWQLPSTMLSNWNDIMLNMSK